MWSQGLWLSSYTWTSYRLLFILVTNEAQSQWVKESWLQIRMVTTTVCSLFKEDAYTVKYWLYVSRSKSSLHFALIFCGPSQSPTISAKFSECKRPVPIWNLCLNLAMLLTQCCLFKETLKFVIYSTLSRCLHKKCTESTNQSDLLFYVLG